MTENNYLFGPPVEMTITPVRTKITIDRVEPMLVDEVEIVTKREQLVTDQLKGELQHRLEAEMQMAMFGCVRVEPPQVLPVDPRKNSAKNILPWFRLDCV